MGKEEIEKALKHIKDRTKYAMVSTNIDLDIIKISVKALEKQLPLEPILMQCAEPEYMCECGYKFYTYNWKPNYCSYCGKKFNWRNYAFKED